MTRQEMLDLAFSFQADITASFDRLLTDEMDKSIKLMMMAAATAAVIERFGEPWQNFEHRSDEFWNIVRDAYAMIKTVRNQTTDTRQ